MTMTKTLDLKNTVNLLFATILIFMASISLAFAGEASEWKNQETKVKGMWSIEQRADGDYLVLSDKFKTRNAPDLKFFASKAEYSSINGKNATKDAVVIAELKSNKGSQSYKIPSDLNLSDYNSLVLHCEQYSKLWASTPLK